MGKNYTKREGKGSLIFIWLLIIILALGTVFVIKNYKDQRSDIIESEALADAFSTTMGKPAGKITAEELANVEGIDFYARGDSSLAIYYLKGFGELESTDDYSKYIVQATISGDEFMSDLDLFTGINSFTIQNYSGADFVFDMNKLSADTYKNLETFYTSGVTVDNSNLIGTHTKLKTLGLSSAGLVSIPDISTLKELEYVDFSYNELTDISALSVLDNEKVTSVVLSGNKIEDYTPIQHIDEDKITKNEPEEETEGTEEGEEVTEGAEEVVEDSEDNTEENTEEAAEETEEGAAEESSGEETEKETSEEDAEENNEEATDDAGEEDADAGEEEAAE